MDLQSRKIEFVQEFLKLQSEEIVSQLEKILRKSNKSFLQDNFIPMSIEEFNLRIDKSMEDSANGRLIESTELKAKIEKWR
jgi:dsDNA-specific endonuclease/ATPase MutS2